MKVELYASFIAQLYAQARYIARDRPAAARKFKKDVLLHVNVLGQRPYSNRRSIYFDGEHYRDMVFKGYKVVYRVDAEQDTVYVIGLVNMQEGLRGA